VSDDRQEKAQKGVAPPAQQPEETLIAVRKEKAAKTRERGENPFANDVTAGEPLVPLAEARARFDGAKNAAGRYDAEKVAPESLRVAGRVLFMRQMGGVSFVRLRDRTGELQLYVDESVLGAAYARLHEDIDLGDFIEATGTAMATQKGELSVKATSFRLLTKAYRPLPTKTSFKDVESRYRMRYVDLVANREVATVFRGRTFIISALRRFFDERGFLEVETPTMHTIIGGAAAKPFKTHHNALDMELFMRIAPELYLKRLVVGGFERVYEIARCYRNEGLSTRHNPEFSMLEYYQAYATYETLMDQTEAMLRFADDELARVLPEEHAAWAKTRTWTFERFVRVPMAKAIENALARSGLPAEAATRVGDDDAPIKVWAKAAKEKKREIDWANFRSGMKKCDSAGERVFCAYEYLAEPFLTADYRSEDGSKSLPVFVIDYPFEVSPLARKKDADGSLVDRFELFVDGRELCNAFSELNDPEDQDARFRAQVEKKAKGGDDGLRRRLCSRARVWHAADGWVRHGRRQAHDVADGVVVDSRRHPLPATPARGERALSDRASFIAFEVVVLLLTAFVGYRAAIQLRAGKMRGIWGVVSALLGLACATLSYFASRVPRERFAPFKWRDEFIGFSALGVSVLFLLGALAAVLPVVLDLLEGRSFSSYVGARHVRATKSGFLTVISVLSMAGVAVSSCALCSVTSIMGGFGADLKRKILGNNAHIVVDATRPGGFGDWEDKLDAVRLAVADKGGAATPVVAGDAMGSSASNTAGALVRGIDTKTIGQVIDLRQNIEVGNFEWLDDPDKLAELPADTIIGRGPGGEPYFKGPDPRVSADLDPEVRAALRRDVKVYPGVIIGKELAKSLHVLVGDEITLLSPMGELGPMGVMPRTRRFRVAAIFYSGMYEYDATHAYIKLDVAQTFFSMGDNISQIDVRVPDPERVADVTPIVAAVAAKFEPVGGEPHRVRDWVEMNRNLFSALKLEKIATFIILSIAIAVASFCIVCTLLLMVTEKGKEIAILKALGASDGAIMRIFMLEGVIIGGIGTVFGVGTALAACSGLARFGVRLDPEVYYIDRLPVNVNGSDYAMVALASLVICTIATLYPARAASKLSPVDGLRYE
jgi:lysyl-tRNA synthetase